MKNIKIVKARYIVDSNGYRHGKAVMCLDTGEVFTSAKECADVKQFPYNDFSTKLRNGKEAKDGKLYCYVSELHYHADAVQTRLYSKAKIEYDTAKLTLASLGKLFD